ncbi:GPI mannosyltransferase 2 [Amylocarpus encephaloides]|uniref:GPI mannosyltransferase 2 n=1 Tax=Amylocarpus encephaloides TaxID=45428 RepID=A0A9P7YGJ7_9HELO|nr:GPI mannosyltransferase 2 [Amylocarpus encephaloides]
MAAILQPSRVLDHPIRNLIVVFSIWKALFLVIACCSPGPGYDTSTSLTLQHVRLEGGNELPIVLRYVVSKLTRWDAIYFVRIAARGYTFEQEWVFGWGFTRFISLCTAGLAKAGVTHYEGLEGILAVLIAHTSHLISVLLLFKLTFAVFPASSTSFSFISAALHVISPAGLFLSAPFAESSCAMLSFAGTLVFVQSLSFARRSSLLGDVLVVISGLLFGAATMFRSNGILNGFLLLEQAIRITWNARLGLRWPSIRRLIATGLGGMSVGGGLLLPQYIAYSEYCKEPGALVLRPWCEAPIPSIYTFAQVHYWNNGLFRYWTAPNIPLFLLAAPMFALMVLSGNWAMNLPKPTRTSKDMVKLDVSPVLGVMGLSQLFLVLFTLLTSHVQIITRISSAYPICLWYVAKLLQDGGYLAKGCLRYMVIYAIVQAGLFSSFLPPA